VERFDIYPFFVSMLSVFFLTGSQVNKKTKRSFEEIRYLIGPLFGIEDKRLQKDHLM
jgi:hypothetical protein